MNAIAMLKADHGKMKKVLTDLETTTERGVKIRAELFSRFKGELTVHEIIEEEIFDSELKAHPKARDIVLEGYEAHHVVDVLMKELEELDVTDESWGAKALVMKENVASQHPTLARGMGDRRVEATRTGCGPASPPRTCLCNGD